VLQPGVIWQGRKPAYTCVRWRRYGRLGPVRYWQSRHKATSTCCCLTSWHRQRSCTDIELGRRKYCRMHAVFEWC